MKKRVVLEQTVNSRVMKMVKQVEKGVVLMLQMLIVSLFAFPAASYALSNQVTLTVGGEEQAIGINNDGSFTSIPSFPVYTNDPTLISENSDISVTFDLGGSIPSAVTNASLGIIVDDLNSDREIHAILGGIDVATNGSVTINAASDTAAVWGRTASGSVSLTQYYDNLVADVVSTTGSIMTVSLNRIRDSIKSNIPELNVDPTGYYHVKIFIDSRLPLGFENGGAVEKLPVVPFDTSAGDSVYLSGTGGLFNDSFSAPTPLTNASLLQGEIRINGATDQSSLVTIPTLWVSGSSYDLGSEGGFTLSNASQVTGAPLGASDSFNQIKITAAGSSIVMDMVEGSGGDSIGIVAGEPSFNGIDQNTSSSITFGLGRLQSTTGPVPVTGTLGLIIDDERNNRSIHAVLDRIEVASDGSFTIPDTAQLALWGRSGSGNDLGETVISNARARVFTTEANTVTVSLDNLRDKIVNKIDQYGNLPLADPTGYYTYQIFISENLPVGYWDSTRNQLYQFPKVPLVNDGNTDTYLTGTGGLFVDDLHSLSPQTVESVGGSNWLNGSHAAHTLDHAYMVQGRFQINPNTFVDPSPSALTNPSGFNPYEALSYGFMLHSPDGPVAYAADTTAISLVLGSGSGSFGMSAGTASTCSSDTPAVATATLSGNGCSVSPVSAGTATITVTDGTDSDTVSVTVAGPAVTADEAQIDLIPRADEIFTVNLSGGTGSYIVRSGYDDSLLNAVVNGTVLTVSLDPLADTAAVLAVIGRTDSVTVEDLSDSSNSVTIPVSVDAMKLKLNGDGAAYTIDTSASNDDYYTSNSSNPVLTMVEGAPLEITFPTGHPFEVIAKGASSYEDTVLLSTATQGSYETAAGASWEENYLADSSKVLWVVPENFGSTIYGLGGEPGYRCNTHLSTMRGEIDFTFPTSLESGAGTVEIGDTSAVTEGSDLVVTVERRGGSDGAVSVDYAIVERTTGADDVAQQDVDYFSNSYSGTLSWSDGDSSNQTITIYTSDDPDPELTERLDVTLTNPTGGVNLGRSSAELEIQDNDSTYTSTCTGGGSSLTIQQPGDNFTYYLSNVNPTAYVDLNLEVCSPPSGAEMRTYLHSSTDGGSTYTNTIEAAEFQSLNSWLASSMQNADGSGDDAYIENTAIFDGSNWSYFDLELFGSEVAPVKYRAEVKLFYQSSEIASDSVDFTLALDETTGGSTSICNSSEKYTFSGTVKSTGGTSLANVALEAQPFWNGWSSEGEFTFTKTKADGSFELKVCPGQYNFEVRTSYYDFGSQQDVVIEGYSGGYLRDVGASTPDLSLVQNWEATPVTVSGSGSTTGLAIQLAQGAVINGTVTNGTAGIPNVMVRAQPYGGGAEWSETKTDSSGDFKLNVKAGTLSDPARYRIEVQTNYWDDSANGGQGGNVNASDYPGGWADGKGGIVGGDWESPEYLTYTSTSGAATTQTLFVDSNFNTTVDGNVCREGGFEVYDHTTQGACEGAGYTWGESISSVTIDLNRGAGGGGERSKITGYLYKDANSNGSYDSEIDEGVSGLMLEAMPDFNSFGGNFEQTLTGSDGSFSLPLDSGTYRLEVRTEYWDELTQSMMRVNTDAIGGFVTSKFTDQTSCTGAGGQWDSWSSTCQLPANTADNTAEKDYTVTGNWDGGQKLEINDNDADRTVNIALATGISISGTIVNGNLSVPTNSMEVSAHTADWMNWYWTEVRANSSDSTVHPSFSLTVEKDAEVAVEIMPGWDSTSGKFDTSGFSGGIFMLNPMATQTDSTGVTCGDTDVGGTWDAGTSTCDKSTNPIFSNASSYSADSGGPH